MTWNMIGGTQVLINNGMNQRRVLMASNHTQCIGMELMVMKNELY